MGQKIENEEELVEFTNGRKIYPEVAEYFSSKRNSDRAYEDAISEVDHEHSKALRTARRAAEDAGRRFDRHGNDDDRQAQRAADAARRAGYEAAGRAQREPNRDLLLNSPHKEVAWIAKVCLFNGQGSEVEGYAMDILKILPATEEEIWEEAKDKRGMCDAFDRFYAQAEAAGVFGDTEGRWAAAREKAALRNYIRRQYGTSYMTEFMPHVDRIVKALNESYDKRLAEAKAEWQRLDEARAENAMRNRSEAARAAWERRRQSEVDAANAASEGTMLPNQARDAILSAVTVS